MGCINIQANFEFDEFEISCIITSRKEYVEFKFKYK